MERKFKSAISIWLVGFVLLVLGGSSLLMLRDGAWPGLLINVPILLWFIHMVLNTYYILSSDTLTITCGIFPKQRIQIDAIYRVTETNNPLSSPALSLDRLEIRYSGRRWVLISPKEKEAFIQTLLRLNPSIEVKRKKA